MRKPKRQPAVVSRGRRRAVGPWGVSAVIVASALIACLPLLLHDQLPQGSDVFSNSHYLMAFMKAFGEGDLYPRWTDQTNLTLGAPSFILLTPFSFYGAGATSWLTGSPVAGFKVYFLLLSIATGAAFYLLAADWVAPGLPAALSAGLYLLLPYHVLDCYQRFALSECTAFLFLPLILLFARRAARGNGRGAVAGLALSYAGLIYTHLVTALLFSLMLGLWLLWETRIRWRALLRPALALAIGLGVAAPALLPAALEKGDSNIAWTREMPNGDFRINFIFSDEPLPGLGFRDPVKPPVFRSAHAELLLGVIAAVLALSWGSPSSGRRRHDILGLACGCLIAYFLQLEVSTPIWRLVPELPSIQFPWRFQTVMVLTAALLFGFALQAGREPGVESPTRRLAGWGIALLGGLVLLNLALAWQNTTLKPYRIDERTLRDPFVRNWIEPAFTPVQFKAYRTFKQAPRVPPRAAFATGSGDIVVESWLSSRRRLTVTSAEGGTVRLGSFWFPGWSATLDGGPLRLAPEDGTGLVTFVVPPGGHEVVLRFVATPTRRAAWLVGVVAISMLLFLAWFSPLLPAPRFSGTGG